MSKVTTQQFPKYTLTDDEKAIIRNIQGQWKEISRLTDGFLYLFYYKYSTRELEYNENCMLILPFHKEIFSFIKFGNPVSLDELRKCL